VAVIGRPPANIVISNADGSSRRAVRTKYPVQQSRGILWSPDGRSIAYLAAGINRRLGIIDVATGAERADVAAPAPDVAPRWRGDSRAILYTSTDPVLAPDSTRSLAIRERTTAGGDRVLRTLRLSCTGGCAAMFINDSLLVMSGPSVSRTYRAYNVRSLADARVVYTQSGPVRGPVVSADGRWIAVGRQTATRENRLIDVVSSDGGSPKTLTLPFVIAAGVIWISPNGRELVVASGSQAMLTFHRVDVATGNTTTLTTITGLNPAAFRISPDGRSLAFDAMETPYVTFHEVDVSALLRGGTPPPQK